MNYHGFVICYLGCAIHKFQLIIQIRNNGVAICKNGFTTHNNGLEISYNGFIAIFFLAQWAFVLKL